MDCPSEIKMIENLFETTDPQIQMEFDLSERNVVFYHENKETLILTQLEELALPGQIVSSEKIEDNEIPEIVESVEAKTLKYLLLINFVMFLVEIFFGFYAQSSGLLADGLDMLADSLVYGVSLYVVGKSIAAKKKSALLSGYMQISLGILCLVEVSRKFYFGSEPISGVMIGISLLALFANVFCLFLIYKHRNGEIHMKASWIFSANDVLVNLGVIVSGLLVYYLESPLPDLLIGVLISIVVIRGGLLIRKMSLS
jgi:Co/Zn/Cd efflux system component